MQFSTFGERETERGRRKEKVSSKKGAGKMRRSLRLFCIIPFFLLFALSPTVHASLKAPRRVSSSPHILKPERKTRSLIRN